MLGLLVVLMLSWLMLRFLLKENLSALGFFSTATRLKEFSVGFMIMAVLCAINILGQSYFKDISYALNSDYGIWEGLIGIWWVLKSALFEELVFRGAILYILIKIVGVVKACIIDAIAFGIYHLFSYQMFGGQIIPMIYVFLLTGASGWIFAFAFAKTKSLYAPLGLHFGWILVSIVVFSTGPIGNQLFIPSGDGIALSGWATLLFFMWQTVFTPGLVTWFLIKRYKAPKNKPIEQFDT